jgi:hypothetical protein
MSKEAQDRIIEAANNLGELEGNMDDFSRLAYQVGTSAELSGNEQILCFSAILHNYAEVETTKGKEKLKKDIVSLIKNS